MSGSASITLPARSTNRLPAAPQVLMEDESKMGKGDLSFIAGVGAGFGTMEPEPITFIGERDAAWANHGNFGLSIPDSRHHLYIIGKTGSGKTTLLHNLIVQHIEAGHGVGLIDPHGDLASEIINYVPSRRTDELVYFNPADLEYPVGLNLLACVPPDTRPKVASGVVSAFKALWHESWGPRLEYILYNAVLALLDCQNVTLLGVNKLLTDQRYRAWVARQIRDPLLREFWLVEFEGYDTRFRREAIAPVQNKVNQFLLAPPLRNILGQVQRKIDFRFMMDRQRIFVANLSKGELGEDKSNLLGSLLTTEFQMAAMSRVNVPENERPDFFLFVDEFQNFVTESFASILAEARKFKLCLTISHQYLDQLPLGVRHAVFGNVGSMVVFRVGQSDAEILAKEFKDEYPANAFSDLRNFEVYLNLLEEGEYKTPFKGRTFPPQGVRYNKSQHMIGRSRERYATPRGVVEDKINRWIHRWTP